MNPFRIDFEDLYRRHLCRHAEFGNNVMHLAAVGGCYLCLLGGLLRILPQSWTIPQSILFTGGLLLPYLLVLARNVPVATLTVTFGVLCLLFGIAVALPAMPIWLYPILAIGCHQFQQLSHRFYTLSRDMTEFEGRYPKGKKRFFLLALYELPILLRYLCFGRSDWASSSAAGDSPVKSPA